MASPHSIARPSVLVIHGPNLNLLGQREPEIYGRLTLAELDGQLLALGEDLDLDVVTAQRNGEGEIVTLIQSASAHAGIVINPGGYTHTSVAIADALRGVDRPAIEVHLSNLYGREPLRHVSITGAACRGVIMGLGPISYHLALRYLAAHVSLPTQPATSSGLAADVPPAGGP
jgi:3-dehydroquinate dehydratase II